MSNFIPNSFQTPNAYVDQFMYLLSGTEYKVLCYLVRRIFGFQKRQDRVSIPQITQGIRKRDGDLRMTVFAAWIICTHSTMKSGSKSATVI